MELIILSIVGSFALLVAHLLDISAGSGAVADDVTIPAWSNPRLRNTAAMTLTVPA